MVEVVRVSNRQWNDQMGWFFPMNRYRTICADPPWDVKRGPAWNSNGRSRPLAYPTMTLEEIKNLSVREISESGCHLYLWTINKYLRQSYEVAESWGFTPSTVIVWTKNPNGIGLGGTFSLTTEFLLFCRKGSLRSLKRFDTTWFNEKRGRHSQKPKLFRRLIEQASPGPRIELFAREKSIGWDVWGNEVKNDVDLTF